MATIRSLSKAKAASFLHRVNISLARRGYTYVAEQGHVSKGSDEKGRSTRYTVEKVEENPKVKQGSVKPSSSWGPDPLTGYYKPSDQVTEVDDVDLRELHHKTPENH